MNTRKSSLFVSVLLIGATLSCLPAMAQSTNPPPISPTPENVLIQAENWLGTFDTNSTTFQGSGMCVSIWNGPKYQSGLTIADTFGMNVDLFKGAAPNSSAFSIDAMVDIAGIGGAVSGFEGGPGITKTLWDVKFGAYGNIGYDNVRNRIFADPCFEINKAFNKSMSTGLEVGFPIYGKGHSALQVPTVRLKAFTVNF